MFPLISLWTGGASVVLKSLRCTSWAKTFDTWDKKKVNACWHVQNKPAALETTRKGSTVLVLWVGEGAGTGLAVIAETPHDTVKSRSAALAPIAFCVVTTALRAGTHRIVPLCHCEGTALELSSLPNPHDPRSLKRFDYLCIKGKGSFGGTMICVLQLNVALDKRNKTTGIVPR